MTSYQNEIFDKYYDKFHKKELKGSNEPSFEEMVGFVENVYKDINNRRK